MINIEIDKLINYWLESKLIEKTDEVYVRNSLHRILDIEVVNPSNTKDSNHISSMNNIVEYAIKNNVTTPDKKEMFIDLIHDVALSKPSDIIKKFNDLQNKSGFEDAFNWFYNTSKASYYVKYDRISKNLEWVADDEHKNIQLTVNVSKPVKSPEQILRESKAKSTTYPKCVICFENVGFAGSTTQNSRINLRYIPVEVKNHKMFFQYSPYGYMDQHFILNDYEHKPMKIDKTTFEKLIYFIDQNKHFFIGSNSDLPIVGGSILSHNHFQGGKASFPMFEANKVFKLEQDGIKIEVLDWLLSTILLTGTDKEKLVSKSMDIFNSWVNYESKELNIVKEKDGKRQNSITPIVRHNGKEFEVYIILRNNNQTDEYPYGQFHLHEDIWNIKKENIGLIEAMGRAILPSYLLEDIDAIANLLENEDDIPNNLDIHAKWIKALRKTYKKPEDKHEFIKRNMSAKYYSGLKHCAVFNEKAQKQFIDFVTSIK